EAVAVLDRSGQHVGHGLDAAMRMPGKASPIIVRALVAEIVEQQKRIELVGRAEPERPTQLYAGALDRRRGLHDSLDWPNRHDEPVWLEETSTSYGNCAPDRPDGPCERCRPRRR